MLKSDYDVWTASPETLEAMRVRCREQSHEFERRYHSFGSDVYQICKWCGVQK